MPQARAMKAAIHERSRLALIGSGFSRSLHNAPSGRRPGSLRIHFRPDENDPLQLPETTEDCLSKTGRADTSGRVLQLYSTHE